MSKIKYGLQISEKDHRTKLGVKNGFERLKMTKLSVSVDRVVDQTRSTKSICFLNIVVTPIRTDLQRLVLYDRLPIPIGRPNCTDSVHNG